MPGFELINKEEERAVSEIFTKSGGVLSRYGLDKKRNNIYRVDEFEKLFAKKFGAGYSLMVSSGTTALLCGLKALGIKPGDEVITQSFTFVATVEAIIEAGAIPVITEVNETLNMDPEDLKKKITKKTKAIIPVHMLGAPCQMDEIMTIARKHKLNVMEDACESLGGTYKGKSLGTIGDIGVFSFDIGKAITTGEGGMIVTDKKELYLKAREYADHGHEQNPKVPRGQDTRRMSGFNFRVGEVQGAIGLVQLKRLDYILKSQRGHKKAIKEGLKNIESITFREIPDQKGDAGDTLIFFFDSKKKAETFVKMWQREGLGTKNIPDAVDWHYAGTWKHMLPQFPRYKGKNLMNVWKKSSELLARGVALPIMVNMDEKQINRTIETVKRIVKELR